MKKYAFEVIGTQFEITVWDEVSDAEFVSLMEDCESRARTFDSLYSRFKSDSLVVELSKTTGTVQVPHDLVAMLRLYERVGEATQGAINPLIGFAMEDIGYDADYSLRPKNSVREVPPFSRAVRIDDDEHVTLHENVLIDLGALGKGYLVDRIYDRIRAEGVSRFLVNGSGDVRYYDEEQRAILCGLEHPLSTQQVIGTLPLIGGALCASATNRRAWGTYNHYIDPSTGQSPEYIVATWVVASEAALADAFSSALFFVAPEDITFAPFEYLILNKDMNIKKSAGFTADFFTDARED